MPSIKTTQTILRGVPVSLPSRDRGSCARDSGGYGKSIVAIGGPGAASIAAGASNTFTFSVREDAHIDRLFVSSTGDYAELTVDSIILNNENLSSGSTTGILFQPDATNSPLFGHAVRVSDDLSVTISNGGAAAATVAVSFSAA